MSARFTAMFWITLLFVLSAVQGKPIKICVPEYLSSACREMESDLPEKFSCVLEPDTLGCLKKVSSGDADLVNADPTAIYAGGFFFNLQPITTELIDGNPHRYEGIAVVRKLSDIESVEDLQNKSSCHTGLGRTVGWKIPIARLLQSQAMEVDCEEGEMAAVHRFFDGSCVPGQWSSDPVVDKKLKSRYPNLCSRCKNPSACSGDDPYAGYEGVLRCISEGAAEIAFTKLPALKEYLVKHPEFEESVELLCFEGGRKSVRDADPCFWGTRPTNAFLARQDDPDDEERLVGVLLETQSRFSIPKISTPEWYHKTFLSNSKVSNLRPTELQKRNYADYLGDFLYTIQKPRHGCGSKQNSFAFCVTSEAELSRCQDYSKAAKGRGLWPELECVKTASKAACMQLLKEGSAHLAVLDGGDVYRAGRYFELQPVASEVYNGSDASYYAVALLRSASDVTKLSDLRGLRSCHTGVGRTAGWVMPIGSLLEEGLLPSGCSSHAAALADFFSGGSCVPGANDTKYNRDRTRSEDLCRHCIGDEQGLNKCSRDSKERFSGYAGALRCLSQGKGDVAFVKHTTVHDYTDGHSKLPWTKDLLSSDFMLLCDRGGTEPVTNYQQCNLGKVPSHQVVANTQGMSPKRRLSLVRLLADSSRYFANDSTFFRLFRAGDQPDLLFKDSATGLKITRFEDTYQHVLGPKFLEASRVTDPKNC